jgi:hypothetical protein
VLLHEYLNFTVTENNTQGHCISYAKLVQDLAEQVPAIVLPYSVQHKIFVDSLHERFRILKTRPSARQNPPTSGPYFWTSPAPHVVRALSPTNIVMKLTLPTLHSPLLASALTALFVTRGHTPRVSALKEEEGARIGQKRSGLSSSIRRRKTTRNECAQRSANKNHETKTAARTRQRWK